MPAVLVQTSPPFPNCQAQPRAVWPTSGPESVRMKFHPEGKQQVWLQHQFSQELAVDFRQTLTFPSLQHCCLRGWQ